jgi:hypothetical protein
MNVDIQEVLAELERQFPKELTICVQAVQIRKLQEEAGSGEPAGNEA